MTFHVKRSNKYNARKVQIYGIWFDSDMEGKHYLVLRDRERKGEIRDLELQPQFKFAIDGRPVLITSAGYPNGRQATFKPDFRYWDEKRKAVVVEDKKSQATKTEAYKLRKALVECIWPGTIIEEV